MITRGRIVVKPSATNITTCNNGIFLNGFVFDSHALPPFMPIISISYALKYSSI